MTKSLTFDYLYNFALSEKVKLKIEKVILIVAMIGFLTHLAMIYLKRYGFLNIFEDSNFLTTPLPPSTPHFLSS